MRTRENNQYAKYKPKRTLYRGTWFKSNLEARVAESLDALEIEWEYETVCLRGAKYPYGQYTPDFWLPELHAHVEVTGRIDEKHLSNALAACDDLGVENPDMDLSCEEQAHPSDEHPVFYLLDGEGYLRDPRAVDDDLQFMACGCPLPVINPAGEWTCPYCGASGNRMLGGDANLFDLARARV